ncbi:XAP5 domain-containing protein [Cordyceps fumosorosea ARSEF 2679]|uniref:XAP5 domain-containing protein n=1 Tax=Cordyceps fumosorosea (strain ARSEF 2679) TaxID=1081104 RepID=A0A167WHT1_CORFA|nr:XAP5 domain-containing protein [Cordyceps fumosorosea ARSEF 2679]OAA63807.1 XAP5 domain-containing protein [Cordyceps fumosorosea ARSEF 2679]
MSEPASSRFTPQNKTTQERLSTNTVGLVALSDFRKRRAEVLEQQEREARDASATGASTPVDRSQAGTPDNNPGSGTGSDSASASGSLRQVKKAKKKQKAGKKLLSFGDDDEEENGNVSEATTAASGSERNKGSKPGNEGDGDLKPKSSGKIKANASVGPGLKTVTKSALRREAAEREALRREFLTMQEAVKVTEIAIPFVFYDGAHTPGGVVRMKKGDFVWVFLDKSRKVGAELGVGEQANATRAWARVGVDDLMIVRGTVIIPHHYDFHYFIINKSVGPGGKRLFDYSGEAPEAAAPEQLAAGLSTAAEIKAAKGLPDISTLEGADEDPMETKVVDRRWYERNKHIYPASTWQEFDPEMDYAKQVRKDGGGNTFFYSK